MTIGQQDDRETELCETTKYYKEEKRARERNLNQIEKIRCDKVSKQCYETKLERVPPECGEKEAYNYQTRRHTNMTDDRSHFSKEEIRKMRSEVTTDSRN